MLAIPLNRLVLALLAAGLLAACSGGSDPTQSQSSTLVNLSRIFAERVSGPPQLPTITRALLDQVNNPWLEVEIEARERKAYLIEQYRVGPVRVWLTGEGGQVVIRDGLVTATRGTGRDLASSDYAEPLEAIRARGGQYQRRLFVRNDVAEQERITLVCELRSLGPVNLEIAEQFFASIRMRETCTYVGGEIVNDYWVDSANNSRIWQSRQWLGPDIGFAKLRLLKD